MGTGNGEMETGNDRVTVVCLPMANDYGLRAKRQPWTVDHSGHH